MERKLLPTVEPTNKLKPMPKYDLLSVSDTARILKISEVTVRILADAFVVVLNSRLIAWRRHRWL